MTSGSIYPLILLCILFLYWPSGTSMALDRSFAEGSQLKNALCNHRRISRAIAQQQDDCVNEHILCNFWSKQGHCFAKKQFMDKHCRASCDPACYCIDKSLWKEPLNCVNHVPYCEFWARQGACSLYRDYMLWKCQKSCDSRCRPQFKFTVEKPTKVKKLKSAQYPH
uniref:ShKT domain-containing protein n=1 Tax=Trichuris muris TaxID=70415 RepID=A0A5S6R2U2_TRIMR